jgi:TolB-like protein
MRLSALLFTLGALGAGCTTGTRSVCVLPYEVITPDPRCEYLSQAVPEFLTNELSRTPLIEVQDPQEANLRIESLRNRWSLRDYSRLDTVGLRLGTDYFILGSITRLEDRFILESRLFSVYRGRVVPGTAFRRTCQTEQGILQEIPGIAGELRHQILMRTPAAAAAQNRSPAQ